MRALVQSLALLVAAGFRMHAQAVPVSPERLALVDSLLTAMDFDRSITGNAAMQLPKLADSSARAGISAYQAFAKKYLTVEAIRPRVANRYAELFSDDELRDMLRFYQSAVGKKFVGLQPSLAQASQAAIAQIVHEHMTEYLQLMSAPPDD